MKKFDKWLTKHKVRSCDLARERNVTEVQVWRWRTGRARPCPANQLWLMKYTKGQIAPNDWLSERRDV